MSGSSGDVGSLIVDDFVVTGDEEDMTLIGDDGEDLSNTIRHVPDYDDDDTNISALTGMPINCPDDEDDGQSAMRGFKFYENVTVKTYTATSVQHSRTQVRCNLVRSVTINHTEVI